MFVERIAHAFFGKAQHFRAGFDIGARLKIMRSAAGTALVRLTEFTVTNGPDLEVWLVKEPDPQTSDDVKQSEWVSLGPLKGNKGDQTYIVPEGTDIGAYGSVVIWCEQFGVLFSPATLTEV